MPARDYTLVLNGSAQQLSAALSDPTVGGVEDVVFQSLTFCPAPANTNVIYVGTRPGITSSLYGFSLDPTQASIPPYGVLGQCKLSDFWVLGTNNEVLHVLGIPV